MADALFSDALLSVRLDTVIEPMFVGQALALLIFFALFSLYDSYVLLLLSYDRAHRIAAVVIELYRRFKSQGGSRAHEFSAEFGTERNFVATHVTSGLDGARSMFVSAVTKTLSSPPDCPWRKRTWPSVESVDQSTRIGKRVDL